MKILSAIALFFALNANAVPSSPWGACAHLNRWEYDRSAEELRLMRQAGIRWVRVDLDWSQVEPKPGQWNFSRWDQLVKLARAEQITVLPILGGNIPGPMKPPYRHQEAWLNYVRTCVKRYQHDLPCWEVMNEVNLAAFWHAAPDAMEYTRLLEITAREIRRINPGLKILYSGLAAGKFPEEFIAVSLQNGAGKYFDIMNLHPYSWKDEPELTLPATFSRLKQLMAHNHLSDKPIWITEIGNSTGAGFPASTVYRAAFRELGFDTSLQEIAYFADDQYRIYSETMNFRVRRDLPPFHSYLAITVPEVPRLDPRRTPVLLLSADEEFPAAFIPPLRDYLKRGGTVIFPAGLPLYFELRLQPDGQRRRTEVKDKHMRSFHLGWDAWWTNPAIPRKVKRLVPVFSTRDTFFPGELEIKRFLNRANLQPGDRFIPLLEGENDHFRAPVAGVYRFNSDLKGNAVVVTIRNPAELCGQDRQADLLTRNAILARTCGVEKVFVYSFRAKEWNPGRESHFGIVRNSLQPKPAYHAYTALVRFMPPGSTTPVLNTIGRNIYHATWRQPTGQTCHAIWTLRDPAEVKISAVGRLEGVWNNLGVPLQFNPEKCSVSSSPIYLVGPEPLVVRPVTENSVRPRNR